MAIATTKEINAAFSHAARQEKAAMEIIARMADGDTDIELDAYRLFESLGWTDTDVRRNVEKMKAVREQQALAGTEGERQAAREAVETIVAENAVEIPKLDEQIAALEEQRRERLKIQDAAEALVSQHIRSVLNLRRMPPQWAERIHAAECRALNMSDDKRRYVAAKSELARARAIAKLRPDEDIRQVRLHCERFQRHMLTGPGNQEVVRHLWDAYQEKTRAAIPGLEAKLAEAKALVDAHVDSIDSLLDVWVSEAGQ